MWKWLAGKRHVEPAALTGAPVARRKKLYTGESGYVYEYFHEGYRVAGHGGVSGAEYRFQVSSDRTHWFPVAVFLQDEAVATWEREHGRDLSSTERYAVVKLALFRAFDERENPSEMREEISVRPADAAEILETLGIG